MPDLVQIESKDGVSVIRMTSGENRFNVPFIKALGDAIARAEATGAPIVLTGDGKFFCNGLDLEWIMKDAANMPATVDALHGLLGRLLVLSVPTVAAINGHAFGAGIFLTAACDYRIMRKDRGYFCFPEVDLGLTLSDGFRAILQTKFPNDALHQGLISGTRYGGEEACRLGFVHEATTEEQLLPSASARVAPLKGKNASALKRQLHERAVKALLGE